MRSVKPEFNMIQKQNMKKKNKKRFRMISLMLVLAMILSFAGCGKDDKGQTSEWTPGTVPGVHSCHGARVELTR